MPEAGHPRRRRVPAPGCSTVSSSAAGADRGDRAGEMGLGAGCRHGRARVALGSGAILAGLIVLPSAVSPTLTVEAGPPVPFDSNGFDDSFAVAQSRPQGPVIYGAETANRMAAAAATPALGDPARGTFGPQVAWPIMPIHAVLLPSTGGSCRTARARTARRPRTTSTTCGTRRPARGQMPTTCCPTPRRPTSSAAPRSCCPTETSRCTAGTTFRPTRTPRTAR